MEETQKEKAKEIILFAINGYERNIFDQMAIVRGRIDSGDLKGAAEFLRLMDKKIVGGWRMVQDIVEPIMFMAFPPEESPLEEVLSPDEEDEEDYVMQNPMRRRTRRYGYNVQTRIRTPRLTVAHNDIMDGGTTPASLVDVLKNTMGAVEEGKKLGATLDALHTTEELLKLKPESEVYKATKERLSKELSDQLAQRAASEIRPLEELEQSQ